MQVAAQIRARPGIRQAAAFMGTPSNRDLLGEAGLSTPDDQRARPEDLILAVDAETDAVAEAALATARQLILERRRAAETAATARPRTLDSALRMMPRANLAAISVPGQHAAFEAMRALKRGLHVFLFSDNVPLQDEIELKREALRRGLFCMGPDCGTAYVNGTGIGFYNVIPRGRIGCVAASGTGLQAVASRLAALGEGISYGIGVGGRDLSEGVGGMMTFFALEALGSDPSTEAIVLISKPPHPSVLPKLKTALRGLGKPTVVCCLGASSPEEGRVRWVGQLDAAADAVANLHCGRAWTPRPFNDPETIRARFAEIRRQQAPAGGILGLFTGGTLAYEAQLILKELVHGLGPEGCGDVEGISHRLLDLGDDEYTRSRPHPMIDPQIRTELILEAGRSPKVGVLLLDLVLGHGAHPDPAASLAAAIREARATAQAAGRRVLAVASVVGTAGDPQNLQAQVRQLADAGAEVIPTNAEATRFAALLVRPELSHVLLETRP
jgi:FdrA protein